LHQKGSDPCDFPEHWVIAAFATRSTSSHWHPPCSMKWMEQSSNYITRN